jgi:hypothetical protein
MRLSLQVDRAELERPGPVEVSWCVKGATAVLLSDVGRVEPDGAIERRVDETTTFVLTAFDAGRGRVACEQATVTVRERAPSGLIVPWWGDGRAPPEGWVVCDGDNDTPDLRGRFVRGAGGDAAPPHRTGGGGAHGHTLDLTGLGNPTTTAAGGHSHALEGSGARGYDRKGARGRSIAGAADAGWAEAGEHRHELAVALPATVSSDESEPRPAWHALHYLMKQ